MHIHILGICGTFMGGIARLAISKGHRVTGSDQNCYPPMSNQLEDLGVELHQGYDASPLDEHPDLVVVGNALSRETPIIEAMLNSNLAYCSGPQWLKENILQDKWVIAVAGTHGKTSTSSMVTWILEQNGFNPGFLIGGVMENFGVSARETNSPFFVVEADEYDTAFFDKRSKFVHYRARTCVINNLEFDHADIFENLSAIENQFHHLVRTIPSEGLIVRPVNSVAIDRVLQRGCWTPIELTDEDKSTQESNQKIVIGEADKTSKWTIRKMTKDGSECQLFLNGELIDGLSWNLIGDHNVYNAMSAIAAARHVGVKPKDSLLALRTFKNVKRRMELKGCSSDVSVYDDFAHHPTAIASTINGLRNKVGKEKIIAIVDPRSNTMRMGCHKESLIEAVSEADVTIFHLPDSYNWQINNKTDSLILEAKNINEILQQLRKNVNNKCHILVMSNGAFGNIHVRLKKLFYPDLLDQSECVNFGNVNS